MTRHIKPLVAAAILLLLSASLALGASVTVNASGNGVFTVYGSDMDGVAGIDLTLKYDTPALSSPTVTQGSLLSGAMMAANPNTLGSIRIAIIRATPFSGSGPIATITFETHTGGGTLTKTSSTLSPMPDVKTAISDTVQTSSATDYNSSGGGSTDTVSSGTGTSTGGSTAGTTTTGTTTTTTTNTTTTGSSNPTYLGTVTMPSDSQPQNEAKPAPAPEAGTKPAEAPATAGTAASTGASGATEAAPAAKAKNEETVGTASNTAVLERFRDYQGEKTPAILIALFKQPISASFRQEPLVALSDGTTTVTIVADLSAESGGSPNFALNGAKLVSLKKDDASPTWFIEALPAKGALSASLMVLSGSQVTEYPLTVAPAIKNAAATEAEFAAFLKNAAKSPAQHDLNGDGKYDGIDDYIYTANYLARQQGAKPTAK